MQPLRGNISALLVLLVVGTVVEIWAAALVKSLWSGRGEPNGADMKFTCRVPGSFHPVMNVHDFRLELGLGNRSFRILQATNTFQWNEAPN